MIKSYFVIAWRNVLRGKVFTVINVFGLASGIAVGLLMFIHVRHELSYDTFFPQHELIYRVASEKWAKTPSTIAVAMKSEYAEMENTGRFYSTTAGIVRSENKVIPTQHNYSVDPSVLSIFEFPFVYGNREKALIDPKSIVITRDLAEKLFGKTDPTGKVIELDDRVELTITGVMENVPSNSHLKIETLRSLEGTNASRNSSRTWKGVDTYVRFKSDEEAASMASKLRDFNYKFLEVGGFTREEIDRNADYLELHPLASIHLYSHREKEMGRNGDIQYVYIFSVLGVFIILIASINFVNLFTARSVRRMREIGLKKVMGASRGQLFRQFLSETFVLTTLSAIVALVLTILVLPFYNDLSGMRLVWTDLFTSVNLLPLGAITLLVSLLSGFYPALVISRYKIIESLGRYTSKFNVGLLKRVLVTFQFAMSCLVILLTVVVARQMHFVRDRDLGLNKEGVVIVKLYGQLMNEVNDDKETLKNQLLGNHNISSVAVSNKLIGERMGYDDFALAGAAEEDEVNSRFVRADEGFVETLGLTLLEGANFRLSDTTAAYIINEEAAKGLSKDRPIGELIGKKFGYPDEAHGSIVGIVKNFNYASLHSEIEPLVISNSDEWPDNLLIRVSDTRNLPSTLEFVKSEISKFAPGSLIVFSVIDDQLALLYETEDKLFAIFNGFSALSVIIAILGLVALSVQSVEARVKEIGIRKVFGASLSDILLILSREYVRLLVIASLFAVPFAWYLANAWLTTFAYKVGLMWWMFAIPCIALVVFTVLILCVQSLRPAMADPVDSLRHE